MSEKRIGENPTVLAVKVKAKQVRVTLSSGDKLLLSVDSFTEFHLYEGKELSEEDLHRINVFASQDQAYDAAIKMLGHDFYSCAEIKRRLYGKGYEPTVVTSVVDRLVALGLLDDARYAKVYAEDVGALRLLGHNHIVYDLRSKGISEDIIATLDFPREKELEKAKTHAAALDRRYYKVPYGKRLLKINHALLERGFDESVAHEAAQAMTTAIDPEVERSELEKAHALAMAKYAKKYQGYELSRHVFAYLARKGFPYETIKTFMEDNDQ